MYTVGNQGIVEAIRCGIWTSRFWREKKIPLGRHSHSAPPRQHEKEAGEAVNLDVLVGHALHGLMGTRTGHRRTEALLTLYSVTALLHLSLAYDTALSDI
jgi:hypothetical protein